VCGELLHVFGTSAVAPLWAGLIANMNQGLEFRKINRVGFLNPLLYGSPAVKQAFNDIVTGNNDVDGQLHKYEARPGWDPCTGMGSPRASELLNVLSGQQKPKPKLVPAKKSRTRSPAKSGS
jgi:kumamolisin